MGSVRLLTRQGEIVLAKGMERGKVRIRKALSRPPVVWRYVLGWYDQLRQGEMRLEDVAELKTQDDEAALKRARGAINRQITRFIRLHEELMEIQAEIASTPERFVRVRAKLTRQAIRVQIRCSQEFRAIPFHPGRWQQFRALWRMPSRRLRR